MRTFGLSNPLENHPILPDTIGTVNLSSGVAVAQDWPSGAAIVRLTGDATFFFNPLSTAANIPTTNSSGTTVSSGLNILMPIYKQDYMFKISSAQSTGYSLIAASAARISLSFWKLSG
jgi:hypothetical protein